ncbi:hypothetical protein [Chloroflexus sp.]|uniref:hypothetical protein n=1 Tax=Chloroflexus sp. TaxID=1904827 RepID=UPI004049EC5D
MQHQILTQSASPNHEECVDPRFADFWGSNDVHANTGKKDNALRIFGYLLGPARIESVNGEAVLAQPFTNVIMQQPLGNTNPAQTSLQKTGLEHLRQLKQEPSLPQSPPETQRAGCRFFKETGFNVCGEFKNFWESNGLNLDDKRGYTDSERIALFGLPISSQRRETAANGSQYLTQWFERARLEYNSIAANMIITPLGRDVVDNQPGLPHLSRNKDVQVNVATITAGGIISARGNGYTNDQFVTITVFRADGASFAAGTEVTPDTNGVTEQYCLEVPANALPGIWAIAFNGVQTGHQTIGFFRVVTTGMPNTTCPDLIAPLPGGNDR